MRCTSAAPAAGSPAGPASKILAYQDSTGAWQEDTAAIALPVIQHRVPPGLPPRSEQVSGAVNLKVLIARSGAVEEVVVVKGLTRAMDQEAVKAVRQWSYRPATLKGEPVAIWMTVTVTFHVTG
jgi:TonB family protein